uniref:Uncharacterized protein n=1 Tax=Onchocerca volvulus TaxID=6282 RepID=A0A8R1XPJ2_ONCVO
MQLIYEFFEAFSSITINIINIKYHRMSLAPPYLQMASLSYIRWDGFTTTSVLLSSLSKFTFHKLINFCNILLHLLLTIQ